MALGHRAKTPLLDLSTAAISFFIKQQQWLKKYLDKKNKIGT
jgi:hypothetical protein